MFRKPGVRFVLYSLFVAAIFMFLSMASCAGGIKGKEQLASEFSLIEGHLAAKPILERNGKRLIVYIGDSTVQEEAKVDKDGIPVPEPNPTTSQPRLTNIRRAVTENEQEDWVLSNIKNMLSDVKIGPEGPTIRLYGKHIKGTVWKEQVGGIDFFFCFLGYDDPVTREDIPVDTCYGDRWRDDFMRFIYEKGKSGITQIPKALK